MKTFITRLLSAAFVAFVCMCSAVSASAKLGETVPHLIKRFGKSYRIESADAGNKYEFRSEKVRVDVLVSNDVSIAETYFSDHALTANGEPPNDIVRAILKTNEPQTRWLEIDAAQFRSDYALRTSDQKYIAFLRYTGPQAEGFIWTMTVGAAKTLMALAAVTTCKGESQTKYPRAIPVHPEELQGLTAREWLLEATSPSFMKDSFELALDEELLAETPYQTPTDDHPRYNDQMERMIGDPKTNDEKTNNYKIRRAYMQGEFVGYIVVQTRESRASESPPAAGTARQWREHNIAPDKYAFECTFDKPLLTQAPYQPPRRGNPYYDQEQDKLVGAYDDCALLRFYERGVFIGYALFVYLPQQLTVTI